MALLEKGRRSPRDYRELTEKELNDIMRDVGDSVRAQTITQKEWLAEQLRNELAAVRAACAGHAATYSKA